MNKQDLILDLLNVSNRVKLAYFEDLFNNLPKLSKIKDTKTQKEFKDILAKWEEDIDHLRINLYEDFINNLASNEDYIPKIHKFLVLECTEIKKEW
jgi:bacterioferritin (cytochrome b1)